MKVTRLTVTVTATGVTLREVFENLLELAEELVLSPDFEEEGMMHISNKDRPVGRPARRIFGYRVNVVEKGDADE